MLRIIVLWVNSSLLAARKLPPVLIASSSAHKLFRCRTHVTDNDKMELFHNTFGSSVVKLAKTGRNGPAALAVTRVTNYTWIYVDLFNLLPDPDRNRDRAENNKKGCGGHRTFKTAANNLPPDTASRGQGCT